LPPVHRGASPTFPLARVDQFQAAERITFRAAAISHDLTERVHDLAAERQGE
jgi:hypothetical protein